MRDETADEAASGPDSGDRRELQEAAESIEAGVSVVVAGPLGTGKTVLTRRLGERLTERGCQPLFLHPAPLPGEAPFEALDAANDERAELVRRGATPAGTVVLVDDAQDLDEASVTALSRAVYARRAVVLFALSVPRVADAAGAGVATTTILDLWLRGFAQRIDLTPVSERRARIIVDRLSRGLLDRITTEAIVWQGNGSRTLLRELTRTAVAAVESDVDPLEAIRSAPAQGGLSAATDAHIRELDVDRMRTLVLIDRAPGLPYGDAVRCVGRSSLDGLLASGFLTEDGSAMRRLHAVTPLARAAARRLGGEYAIALADRSVADLLPRAGEPVDEALANAVASQLFLHPHAAAALASETREEVLVGAARSANDHEDYGIAAAYAALGLEGGDSERLRVEHFYARTMLADAVSAPRSVGGLSGAARVRAAMLRTRLATRSRHAPAEELERALADTIAGAESSAGEHLEHQLLEAQRATAEMRWEDGVRAAEAVITDAPAEVGVRVRALMTLVVTTAMRGDGGATRRELERVRLVLDTDHDGPVDGIARASLLCGALMAAQIVGEDPSPLGPHIAELRRLAVRTGCRRLTALTGLATSLALALDADTDAAVTELRMARRRLHPAPQDPLVPFLKLCIAYLLALRGRADVAEEILARIGAVWGTASPVLEQSFAATESVVSLVAGRTNLARDAARRALELSSRLDAPPVRVRDLYRAIVLGIEPDRMRHEITAAAAESDAAIVESLVLLALGSDEGNTTDALELLRRTVAWAGSTPGSSGPTTAPAMSSTKRTLAVLTRREREIAHLIDEGMSNREIASRLFLSVRTVESHIFQARRKIGARTRRELGRFVTRGLSPQNDRWRAAPTA
ncbi:DNA-binding CsgD family transcriptional regulator [Microbacterium sp. SORGH_AS428]|uniref:LuxR C-terminal-related transcriptional regulator n=1 Tax=Microbacterium sp. SORGH_AS_0428 TaxID=3041788 RepID=UPI0028649EC0|nr:LuxR C-terminal-related transcriptional regulator [Microbacterium sp. SORGH_AS_0428]MDR6198850.1 DNA-binding CsgD family transcriptional regulator [Microbacterium sp. SORGH_AS_0428]